jgi:transposase
MEKPELPLQDQINAPDFDPERLGARFWYEQYLQQQERIEQLEQQVQQLQEALHKLTHQDSSNSSQPPSQDRYKKAKPKPSSRKRGPKYGHPGSTRNGFGWIDQSIELTMNHCPACGNAVAPVTEGDVVRQQVAELARKPVEVVEYQRALYCCCQCGWQGRSELGNFYQTIYQLVRMDKNIPFG